jgi:hypothetical protein
MRLFEQVKNLKPDKRQSAAIAALWKKFKPD